MIFEEPLVKIDVDPQFIASFFIKRDYPVICKEGLSKDHQFVTVHKSINGSYEFLFAKEGALIEKSEFKTVCPTYEALHDTIDKQRVIEAIDKIVKKVGVAEGQDWDKEFEKELGL